MSSLSLGPSASNNTPLTPAPPHPRPSSHPTPALSQAEPLVEFQSPSPCTCAAFFPAEEALLAGYRDGSARLFSLRSHLPAVVWSSSRHVDPIVAVVVHPKGRPLAITACRWV